jgi:hypothetical protein
MARQTIPTLRCDRCHKIAQLGSEREIPEGWYQIAVGTDEEKKPDKGKLDFCGLLCVEKWAKERRSVLAEHTDTNGSRITCPVCDEKIAPQGFANHVRGHISQGVISDEEAADIIGRVKAHA